MGNMDQFADLTVGKRRFRQASMSKVHDAGDHNFHEVSTLPAQITDQFPVLLHGFVTSSHDRSVVPLFVNGKDRCPVGDPIGRCQFHRPF